MNNSDDDEVFVEEVEGPNQRTPTATPHDSDASSVMGLPGEDSDDDPPSVENISSSSDMDDAHTPPDSSDSDLDPAPAPVPRELQNKQTSRSGFRLASGNLQGKLFMTSEQEHFASQLKKRQIDLFFGQEAKGPNHVRRVDGYMAWTGASIGGNGMCNVVYAREAVFRQIAPVRKLSSPRIQVLQLRYAGNLMHFVNVHRPHKGHRVATRNAFDAALDVAVKTLKGECFVMGDFNGELDLPTAVLRGVVHRDFAPFLQTTSLDDSLNTLITDLDLRVMNHAFAQMKNEWPEPLGATWTGNNGTHKILDYIMAPASRTSWFASLSRTSPLLLPTDHLPLMAVIKPPTDFTEKRRRQRAPPNLPTTSITRKQRATLHSNNEANLRKRVRDEQHAANTDERRVPWSALPAADRAKRRNARRQIKRHLIQLEGLRWRRVVKSMTASADAGNMKRAFEILNEAMGKSMHIGLPTDQEIRDAAKAAIQSLTATPPLTERLEIPPAPSADASPDILAHRTIEAFVDGSKFYDHRRKRAGAGVFIPSLGVRIRCQVPLYMRQTPTAGEVCSVLATFRRLRHLPPEVCVHIISDCEYVVFYLNNRLEMMQQQDFSDVSHPDLWREIVRELVDFPRPFLASWIRSHTKNKDEWTAHNKVADEEAKMAARGIGIEEDPHIDTSPVRTVIRYGPPILLETGAAILALNSTAPGIDQVSAAILKLPENLGAIQDIMLHIWRDSAVPPEMITTLLSFIPKANKTDFRALTMMNTIVKVVCNIIRARLRVLPLLPCQYGFQRGRDTLMAIRMLRRAIRNARKKGIHLYVVFVDYSDAYNSLDRAQLWEVLAARGVPKNVIDIIRSTYDGATTVVKGVDDIEFLATSGVKQGCPLSPDLFNLALDMAIRASTLSSDVCSCLAYADDLVIFGTDFDVVQSHVWSIEECSARLGLRMNLKTGKTEAMMIMSPLHEQRFHAHSADRHKSPNLKGALSGDPLSSTADTRNHCAYTIETYATHLYCPICAYIQERHTDDRKAFELLRNHFARAHHGRTLDMAPPITKLSHLLSPFLARSPILPIPCDLAFTLNLPAITIRWVTSYKYLGQEIDATASTAHSVAARVKKAYAAFYMFDKLWDIPTLEKRIKFWLFETIILPTLTSTLATVCPSSEDIKVLQRFHTYALTRIIGDTELVNTWGQKVQITYKEALFWANGEAIDEQLRTLRLNLAGRIARSNRDHPLLNTHSDEWDALITADLQSRAANPAILTDRYNLRKLLRRPNPHCNGKKE